jgi:hypothetical protein
MSIQLHRLLVQQISRPRECGLNVIAFTVDGQLAAI